MIFVDSLVSASNCCLLKQTTKMDGLRPVKLHRFVECQPGDSDRVSAALDISVRVVVSQVGAGAFGAFVRSGFGCLHCCYLADLRFLQIPPDTPPSCSQLRVFTIDLHVSLYLDFMIFTTSCDSQSQGLLRSWHHWKRSWKCHPPRIMQTFRVMHDQRFWMLDFVCCHVLSMLSGWVEERVGQWFQTQTLTRAPTEHLAVATVIASWRSSQMHRIPLVDMNGVPCKISDKKSLEVAHLIADGARRIDSSVLLYRLLETRSALGLQLFGWPFEK